MPREPKKMAALLAAIALSSSVLAACSSSNSGSSSTADSNAKVEISYFTWSDATATAQANALVKAFEAQYPNITVKLDANPGGADGDNLVKTRLSTDEMSDVFQYNSGSLLKALNPDQTLLDLSGQPWMNNVDDNFKKSVSGDNGVYGAPTGTSQAGGIIYSKKVYQQLGLSVPATWAEFQANNAKIKAAKIDPVFQAYGNSWTSQLMVLGSFANVSSADPGWAAGYTEGKRKYADAPAFAGFKDLQDLADAGYFNQNFPSATNDQAIAALVNGTAAQYPMLTSVALSNARQNFPNNIGDLGIFPIPADSADHTALTVWEPNALYIPKTTKGDKLAAAEKFVAFFNSAKGCELQNQTEPGGPYVIKDCTLPANVSPMVTDVKSWVDKGKSGLALEFISPVKGPNLDKILVEVGSKITPGDKGAAAYDDDVKKQAQQLGLPGW
jgi:raffinose/stachyose/melibiose transport system substrate-binding protein